MIDLTRKLRYKNSELGESPSWRYGQLKKDAPRDVKKRICIVKFYDEFNNEYVWSPLKGEVNDVLKIARQLILAEELNFPYIQNPEKREDIDELKLFLNSFRKKEGVF